ncbi:NisI/SpaI family lantibiotic immunity lipoprotein [Clostridium sp. KNHs214]|uniref:NisI/SpaI family lantibiotic immunity lipoprotein n=1 Tax=Clostridium sp. KNHs214 TaxID=1540257 RepID=UPI000553DB03|nr:NisI/SpaI family lantibiotic immunity lipoprotein [Clostridium sp. KNHs214]
MKRRLGVIITLFLIVLCVSFLGCSKIRQLTTNAYKNKEAQKNLPKYTFNEENLKEISYKGRVYCIKEDSFAVDDLDKPIGKISECVTVDVNNKKLRKEELKKIYAISSEELKGKSADLNFGWVYSVKHKDSKKVVAIVVNQNLRKAEIKK